MLKDLNRLLFRFLQDDLPRAYISSWNIINGSHMGSKEAVYLLLNVFM